MKNIHVLSKNKPSRLRIGSDGLNLSRLEFIEATDKQNIYITNNEEIKERDWYLDLDLGKVCKNINPNEVSFNTKKKIILTDNKDLIKDGVQAIDDEFLEWFVNNSSYEFVETKVINELFRGCLGGVNFYKAIIPSSEKLKDI